MGNNINRVLDAAGRAVDTAAKATTVIVNKGKEQVEYRTLKMKLAKLQKQLGALVYVSRKSGQSNEEMIEHYIKEIDEMNALIAKIDKIRPDDFTVIECPECGQGVKEDAIFCGRCGKELPPEEDSCVNENSPERE